MLDVEATLEINSDGEDTSSTGHISHNLDTTFAATTGTIVPINTVMVNAVAEATFSSDHDQAADICASIDDETTCTSFIRYILRMPIIRQD